MLKMIRPAIILLAVFTLITGIAYPLAVTGVVQLLFPFQANGSIMTREGKSAGSSLIGQPFEGAGYFWGRPSATSPYPYNAAASSGSNLSQGNPGLLDRVQAREALLKDAGQVNKPAPVDLLTASGSGLDPHISPASAEYQVHRVAAERGLDEARVRALVAANTEGRQFGIFGEPRVNVLRLNLELDKLR